MGDRHCARLFFGQYMLQHKTLIYERHDCMSVYYLVFHPGM